MHAAKFDKASHALTDNVEDVALPRSIIILGGKDKYIATSDKSQPYT